MKLKIKYATGQQMITRRERELVVSEEQLDHVLGSIGAVEFDKQPSAAEIIDYFDGRGEFANFVELSARHEDVKALLDRAVDGLHTIRRKGTLLKSSTVVAGYEGASSVITCRRVP